MRRKDGKPDPAWVEALDTPRPGVRKAAAAALVKGGGPEARPAVRKLFAYKDMTVRLRTALALAPHDAEAIPVLIELIAHAQGEQSWQAHDFLCQLAGDKAPPHPEYTAQARKKCSSDWTAY